MTTLTLTRTRTDRRHRRDGWLATLARDYAEAPPTWAPTRAAAVLMAWDRATTNRQP